MNSQVQVFIMIFNNIMFQDRPIEQNITVAEQLRAPAQGPRSSQVNPHWRRLQSTHSALEMFGYTAPQKEDLDAHNHWRRLVRNIVGGNQNVGG